VKLTYEETGLPLAITEATYSSRKYATKNRKPVAQKRVLVTGAAGSIGSEIVPLLRQRRGLHVTATDVNSLDVTRAVPPHYQADSFDTVFHIAGAKHAPVGETHPEETWRVNVEGTANVLAAFPKAKIVLASTCKACNPETVYGASKLIAERMVLNAGGVVVRYFNVRETAGNVFRLWETLDTSEPIPVTDCWRYFISSKQAVDLTLAAADLPSGRYTVDPGEPTHMLAEARRLYPARHLAPIARRRGDRYREPLHAAHEHFVQVPHLTIPNLVEIVSPHDFSSDMDLWRDLYGVRDAA
jgi:FlaA1/EpsC-like NDP-sugar epimerase